MWVWRYILNADLDLTSFPSKASTSGHKISEISGIVRLVGWLVG